MNRPSPSTDSQRGIQDLSIELLSLVDDVTDEQIGDLRRHIKPEFHETFDTETNDTRLILTALYRMGYENLVKLRKTNKSVYIVGLHDIRNRLAFLFCAVPEIEEKWKKDK